MGTIIWAGLTILGWTLVGIVGLYLLAIAICFVYMMKAASGILNSFWSNF